MNTIEAMKTRRSCRDFLDRMPNEQTIREIAEAGSYAASGMNRQAPIIICVTDRRTRDWLSELNARIMGKENFDPFYGAPAILIVLADKNVPTHVYDGSLVMGNLMLAASEKGLASCWIHRAKEEFETEEGRELLKSLGIEGDYEGIGHCALGYAATPAAPAPARKENYIRFVK
ncbi:MAG: nitroreductase [Ruminococcus sp.]|nr:nitroreductase [Ruminococcus sp.]